MRSKFLTLSSIALLSGCAYALDSQTQEIMFVTPGANDAVCFAYIDGLKYKVNPPESTIVSKSDESMKVDCRAPGNRQQMVVIEPGYSKNAGWNVANAGVGLPWDYLSQSMYAYPDTIEIDFTNVPLLPESLPAQNNPDIKQPEEYPLEEFTPASPRLNSDYNQPPVEIYKRQRSSALPPEPTVGNAFSQDGVSSTKSEGKGNLQSVVKSYGAAIDPSASANASPTPLVPGE